MLACAAAAGEKARRRRTAYWLGTHEMARRPSVCHVRKFAEVRRRVTASEPIHPLQAQARRDVSERGGVLVYIFAVIRDRTRPPS